MPLRSVPFKRCVAWSLVRRDAICSHLCARAGSGECSTILFSIVCFYANQIPICLAVAFSCFVHLHHAWLIFFETPSPRASEAATAMSNQPILAILNRRAQALMQDFLFFHPPVRRFPQVLFCMHFICRCENPSFHLP